MVVPLLLCAPRLVVEVDGASHRGRAAQDARRDCKLARVCYRVLRTEASVVMQDIDAAVALVWAALREVP